MGWARGRSAAGLLAVAVLAATVVVAGSPPAGADVTRARRVLVFSMPYVSWADLDRADTPHLDRFVRAAAVAGLSTRVHDRETPLGDGYATIGAGTRTVATQDAAGGGLMVDERFGAATAGEAYRQRTGIRPRGAIVQAGIVGLLGANAALHYDTDVGALAEALDDAGIDRAVIGNADGQEPDAARSALDETPAPARQRLAVLGVMDHAGQVPDGQVDARVLTPDVAAPFGVRLDPPAVTDAFRAVWRGRTVTLVEASDLVRVARYTPYATEGEHQRQIDVALRRADRLFAALLARVDLSRDVVMVLGPAHSPDGVTLTPLAIRGPGFGPGLLSSATTRRDGFVQVQDVAPTILAALGVDAPDSMEGRPAEVGGRGGSAADRLDFIRREDAAAQFRDGLIGAVYVGLVVVTAVVLAVGILLGLRARPGRWRAVSVLLALYAIELLVAAFLVRLLPAHEWGRGGYAAAVLAIGAVLAGGCALVGRRRPVDGLITALLVLVGVLTLDALRGAPLVLNSTLGYSPTVAGRFAGFGNPAYAAYSAAALCAAVLLAHRLGGRRGHVVAGAVLTVAVVVDVAPMWGSDVGGILSMVPAYLVAMAMLTGRRVRVRTVVIGAAAVGAVGVLAALVDFARPADQRTHLGRLVEQVRDNGIGELTSVVQRKLELNLATLGTNLLGLVLLLTVVGGAVLWRHHRPAVRAVLDAIPEWRAACVAFVVLAVLGFALNDSGMTVPGIMLVVFVASWVLLLVTVADDRATVDRPRGGAAAADVPAEVPA